MSNLTPEQRHRVMSRIHSTDTSIEVSLRKALWHKGYRYRKNYKLLPGKPDIAITKHKIAIFCDSDFFHGKDWETVLLPRIRRGNNAEYWENKIRRNMERDKRNTEKLNALGWTVFRFWGSEISKNLDECVRTIDEAVFDRMISDAGDL